MKFLILIFLLILPQYLLSQEDKTSEIISSIAEQLAADDSDPGAAQTYTERLSELAEDPVNLNSASAEELSRLFFLTDFQIKALEDYSHSSGKIFSVYELANIPGFDRTAVEMMVPFVTIENVTVTPKGNTNFSNALLMNGIYKPNDDSSFLGSPVKLLCRYKFSSASFAGGITSEKDAGEKLFSGNPPRPDFFSAYMSYKGTGFIRKLVIGDFSARFGQGTGINSGTSSFLSLTAPSFMSSRTEIRPYTSTDENNFFRGVAMEMGLGNILLSVFWSDNKIDATQEPGSDYITGFYTAGLHTSSSQMIKKDILSDKSYGIHASYNFKNLRTGILATADRLSIPVVIDTSDPQKINDFSGNRNEIVSAYYNALIRKILLFGEISFTSTLRHAFIQGISMRMSDRLTVNGMLRSYDPGYSSLHGKGPGGGTGNESSIMAGFTFEAAKHLFISGGSEVKEIPWLKYRCSSPSFSVREEIRLRYLPAENITIEGLYNFRSAMTDDPESAGIPSLKETKSDYFKAAARYSPAENVTFSTRIDYKKVRPGESKGFMMLQDLSYSFSKIPLSIWMRYCLFSTGSWDARLYAYENDLLYSFSIPALSGTGSRSYVMLKYSVGKAADVRLKYGFTSGEGKKDEQEVKVQVLLRF